jgi:hypothetical protein
VSCGREACTSRHPIVPLKNSARQLHARVRCRPCPRTSPSRGVPTRTVGGCSDLRPEWRAPTGPAAEQPSTEATRRPGRLTALRDPEPREPSVPPLRTSNGSAPNARASPAGEKLYESTTGRIPLRYSARQVQALVRRRHHFRIMASQSESVKRNPRTPPIAPPMRAAGTRRLSAA